jgi:single-stranded-DNA-specific exonuclease
VTTSASPNTGKNRKKWRLADPPPDGFHLDLGGVSPVLAHGPLVNRLLFNRNIRSRAVANTYLNPSIESLSDPFLLPDMEVAARRLLHAIRNGERVGIFGDFDVDGLTATAIVVRTIEELGGEAMPFIPNRESDGHGLSHGAVKAFAEADVKLIITVDTGSTAIDEVKAASAVGIDTIITDHHLLDGDLPDAIAMVNPQSATNPDAKALTGAGVAFKLAQAVFGLADADVPFDLMSLAALGTIGDSGPLTGENRLLTRFGLEELGRTRHAGLQALLDIARPRSANGRPDTELISFYVGPRLNAPGRLGDAEPSLRILTTTDHEEAAILAARLDSANNERKRLSEEVWVTAQAQIDNAPADRNLISIRCDGFPAGILGPLAGRLADVYRSPAVAYSVTDGVARASARSIPGFDLHAALTPLASTLVRFGGHAAAAGFTVEEGYLDAVLAEMERAAAWSMMGREPDPVIDVDAETLLSDMGASMWDFVAAMEPFGSANSKPIFLSRGVTPTAVKTIGAGGKHLRMTVEHDGRKVDAIGFGLGDAPLGRGPVDIVYELRSDTWKGRVRKELGLKDIRPSRR